jgi:hypothetical protein
MKKRRKIMPESKKQKILKELNRYMNHHEKNSKELIGTQRHAATALAFNKAIEIVESILGK